MSRRYCLVLDDDPVAAVFLVELVTTRGLVVDLARTLREADQRLAQQRYDLLLVDRRLPDGDGVRWLARVLSSPGLRPGPRCLVTSGDLIEAALLPAGVGQLRKPVEAGHLVAWLANDPGLAQGAPDIPLADAWPAAEMADLLDDAGALARFGGNRDALRSLRAMLKVELEDSANWRPQLRQPTPPAAAIDAVHRLRAACALTGCARLGAVSESIESDLRRGLAMPGATVDEFDAIVAATIAAIADGASVDHGEASSLRAQRSNPGS